MRSFGNFQLAAVDAGRFRLDGGAMFGVVPKPVWERQAPADEHNRIELALRLLLIVDDSGNHPRRILVDTGIGDKFDDKMNDLLYIRPPEGGVRGAVQRAGVDPDDITDVILTHLHFDHAGGATSEVDGQLQPTFPNAVYHVQRRAYKWAEHAPEKDSKSFREDDFEAISSAGQLHLLDGPVEIFEGISLVLSEGHTVAQQLPVIDGGADGKLLYCGDVIPTRAHIRLPWIMGFDLYPLTTLEEKRMLLAQALDEEWSLFFEHDPEVAACRLEESDGAAVTGEALEF